MKRFGCLVLSLMLPLSAADAAIVINVSQEGSSVVARGSGSFQASRLGQAIPSSYDSGTNPRFALIRVGEGGDFDIFDVAMTGPGAFGTNFYTGASFGTGDIFGLYGLASFKSGFVYLPRNYRRGTALAGTATFLNATFATLGMTTGRYVFTTPDDTITVNIGNASGAVPEPSGWALMIAGFGSVAAALRRRRAPRPSLK